MSLPDERLIEQHRKMLTVRIMEGRHAQLLAEGKIQLMSHFGAGREAVAIGVAGEPLRKEGKDATAAAFGFMVTKSLRAGNISISSILLCPEGCCPNDTHSGEPCFGRHVYAG